jgi:hypothetical protein
VTRARDENLYGLITFHEPAVPFVPPVSHPGPTVAEQAMAARITVLEGEVAYLFKMLRIVRDRQ